MSGAFGIARPSPRRVVAAGLVLLTVGVLSQIFYFDVWRLVFQALDRGPSVPNPPLMLAWLFYGGLRSLPMTMILCGSILVLVPALRRWWSWRWER